MLQHSTYWEPQDELMTVFVGCFGTVLLLFLGEEWGVGVKAVLH